MQRSNPYAPLVTAKNDTQTSNGSSITINLADHINGLNLSHILAVNIQTNIYVGLMLDVIRLANKTVVQLITHTIPICSDISDLYAFAHIAGKTVYNGTITTNMS